MKDTEGMNKEEKRRYIFAPNPDFKEGRFNWITNNLLGYIRTFLDGIEYFRIQGKGKPVGKSPRGSGNLSVPILINTALEFVAELYAGKTNCMEFDTDITFKEDLESGVISEELKREFKIRKFPLSETNEIAKTDKGWEIKDKKMDKTYYFVTKDKKERRYLFTWDDVSKSNAKFQEFLIDDLKMSWAESKEPEKTHEGKTITVSEGGKSLTFSLNEETNEVTLLVDKKCRVFISQKKNGKRNIYEMKAKKLIFYFHDKGEYDATTNAKKFIMRYFPETYKEIPLLFRDGIRNGLVHTFSPKPFEYKGSYIRFQFYVDDQNFPSHIEKVKGFLFGIDIDAKFETKLNNGDVPEELENNFKTMNLPLPNTIRKEGTYWELTDGVDTLYALEKEDKEKINVYNYIIQIRINVFELFRVLEKAIETYRAELENSDELQDKFIRAWSSIEEYTEKAGEKQEKEVNELNKCLNQRNHAFLLKDLNARLSVDLLKIYSFNSLKIRRS